MKNVSTKLVYSSQNYQAEAEAELQNIYLKLSSSSLFYFVEEWELLFKYLFTFIKTVKGDIFVTNDVHFPQKTNRILPSPAMTLF